MSNIANTKSLRCYNKTKSTNTSPHFFRFNNISCANNTSKNKKLTKALCYKKILKLATIKERCTKELKNRLVNEEGFSEEAFSHALQKAIDLNIVDDLRFAECYCRTKIASKRGLDGILKFLDEQEIDYLSSPEILSLIKNAKENQLEIAVEVLSKHPSNAKNKYSSYIGKLIRRGFDYETAQNATKKYLKYYENYKKS